VILSENSTCLGTSTSRQHRSAAFASGLQTSSRPTPALYRFRRLIDSSCSERVGTTVTTWQRRQKVLDERLESGERHALTGSFAF
jgi:hypothetical protein